MQGKLSLKQIQRLPTLLEIMYSTMATVLVAEFPGLPYEAAWEMVHENFEEFVSEGYAELERYRHS